MAKEYNIARITPQCSKCSRQFTPGEEFVAVLRETKDDFAREDYCPGCWQAPAEAQNDLVGQWRSHVPAAKEKKKLLVDDDLLLSFFERLEGAEEPAKVAFRYVLALVLMRKKLLVYDGREVLAGDGEKWKVHLKGTDRALEVVDPRMDEEKIAQISQHLGEILQGEL